MSSLVRFRYDLANAFALAVESVRAHKLRSLLTLLGVIIGVGSVVIVGSAIEGLGLYAEQSTSKVFGSETYLVSQIGSVAGRKEYFEKLRRNKPVRPDDLAFIETATGDRIMYSPYLRRTENVRYENQLIEDVSLLGVAANMAQMRDFTISQGRFFTDQENQTRQNVAVIGDDVSSKLFPGVSPLDRNVRISGTEFRVIGVLEKMGSAFGRSMDTTAYIPYTVYRRLFGTSGGMAVFARAREGTGMSMPQALDLTRVALRTRFRQKPTEVDRFDSVTPDSIRSFIDQILGMISAVIVPVTCISLVVGGIVIMNIMLVSVTERTREIGIRKSLGARESDIRMQFLLEAVILAALGGAAGLLLGAGLTSVLARVFEISLKVTLPYVILALGVSSVVGILSGWYPAVRAARLDPIAALRAE